MNKMYEETDWLLYISGQFDQLKSIYENYEFFATIISEWNSFVCIQYVCVWVYLNWVYVFVQGLFLMLRLHMLHCLKCFNDCRDVQTPTTSFYNRVNKLYIYSANSKCFFPLNFCNIHLKYFSCWISFACLANS